MPKVRKATWKAIVILRDQDVMRCQKGRKKKVSHDHPDVASLRSSKRPLLAGYTMVDASPLIRTYNCLTSDREKRLPKSAALLLVLLIMFGLISGGPLTLFGGDNVVLGQFVISIVILFTGAFLSLGGSADIPRTHFAPSPVYISVRKSKGSTTVEKISLRDFVQSKLPSLRSPFVPAWWLFK
jgi:hypothetical protein